MLKLTNPISNGKYDRLHLKPGSPENELLEYIKNPPEGSVVMNITPELAAKMLERNIDNRPITASLIGHYARQIAAGDWHYTREPVKFNSLGELDDGQHRLLACIAAGVAFKTDVVFNTPPEAFAYMDMGKARTAGDIFAIKEVPNSKHVPAALGWVLRYEAGYLNRSFSGKGSLAKPTASELYQAYLGREDIQESISYGVRFQKGRLAPPSMMTALHYICAKKCRRDANTFFETAATGFGAKSRSDPAIVLHHKLVENAGSNERMQSRSIAGYVLTAWNKSRAGLSGRGLRFDPDKPFPRAQ